MLYCCSAGVGRTGTFIAIDALAQFGLRKGTVNVTKYVSAMRRDRMHMIQTTVLWKKNDILCTKESKTKMLIFLVLRTKYMKFLLKRLNIKLKVLRYLITTTRKELSLGLRSNSFRLLIRHIVFWHNKTNFKFLYFRANI